MVKQFLVDLLLIMSALYIARMVWRGIKKGRAKTKDDASHEKIRMPLSYWLVIIGQAMLILALILFLIAMHCFIQ